MKISNNGDVSKLFRAGVLGLALTVLFATASSLHARDKRFQGRANAVPVSAPERPTQTGGNWAYFLGQLDIDNRPFYGKYGRDFKWAYSHRVPLPADPRVVVSMHGSGAGEGAMRVFGPSPLGDIELRNQDAEAYSTDWREWWTFGPGGVPAPGRRIAATLEFLLQRYGFDPDGRGLVLDGPSMGGAGAVMQTMLLPDPWRERIAYSTARVGVIMPRRIYASNPGQYRSFPPDAGKSRWLWDKIDFSIQAAKDPVVRGIHYRHAFGSNDQFSAGPDGNTQLEFVNLVEQHKIGGAFSWVRGGHSSAEAGVNIPQLNRFEVAEQDVTLDRVHPAITQSTGNYPLTAQQRVNETKYPRGHYNLGIRWHHGKIVDTASQMVIPLRYKQHKGLGKGVPDQPHDITVSVTPRRPRNFELRDGEVLHWSWARGALKGTATVHGDTLTIDNIPLVSGEPYKKLKIYRANR